MTTSIGMPILVQSDTGRFRSGEIAGNISVDGNTADCYVFSDGNTWETAAISDNVSYMRYQLVKGTGVGQWQPNPAGLGPTGATGPSGANGTNGVGLGSLTTNLPGITSGVPTRVIGTAFQPSTTNASFVQYRAQASVTASLAGNNQGRIRIRVGSTSTTTAEFPGAVGVTYNLGLGVSLANTNANEGTLYAFVPAGSWVLIDTVTVSGSPAFTLQSNSTVLGSQVEQLLN